MMKITEKEATAVEDVRGKIKSVKLVDWLECCNCGDSPLLILSEFDDTDKSYCYDGDIVKCPICGKKGFIVSHHDIADVCWRDDW